MGLAAQGNAGPGPGPNQRTAFDMGNGEVAVRLTGRPRTQTAGRAPRWWAARLGGGPCALVAGRALTWRAARSHGGPRDRPAASPCVPSLCILLSASILRRRSRSRSPLLVPVEDPEEQRARLAMLGLTGRYNERPHATGAPASWKAAQHKSAHGPSPRTRMQMGKGPFGWLENNKDVEGRDKMWEEQQVSCRPARRAHAPHAVQMPRSAAPTPTHWHALQAACKCR